MNPYSGKYSRCSIEQSQVEEIFIKQHPFKKNALFTWCKQNKESSSDFFCVPLGTEQIPTKWQIKTLDTGRFNNLYWKKLLFLSIPTQKDNECLFRLAMHVLRDAAIPFCLLLARYERPKVGHVVSCKVPMTCLKMFIESQVLQNNLEEKIKNNNNNNNINSGSSSDENNIYEEQIKAESIRIRSYWKDNGIEDTLFREISLALLNIRSSLKENEPPCILLHSIPDDSTLVIWFRDFDILTKHYHHQVMSLYEKAGRSGSNLQFISWPILHHSIDLEGPEVKCERPKCIKTSGPITMEFVDSTFKSHIGPMKREFNSILQARMRRAWNENYRPKLEKDINKALEQIKNEGVISTPEQEEKINEDMEFKYRVIAARDKKEMEIALRKEMYVKLQRCGKCKRVMYCSRECQIDDWKRHKQICNIK